jgi:two-component system, LytTR family, response regulator
MIRTVIIDDEPRNIKLIRGIVEEYCPQLEIVGATDDFMEVLSVIEVAKPSLVLLDIEFPAGNIFPLLERLTFTNFLIIFITAHNTYASEAFKQNAVDYILKPVSKEAVINAVKRAEARINNEIKTDISRLAQILRSELSHSRKIPLPSSNGILFINEPDIIRCEANGRYTIIYTITEKKLTVTKTLKEIESLLGPAHFVRVHNSHLINLEKIKKYHRGQGGSLELTDGSIVEVASSRKDELLKILLNRSENPLH